MIKLVYNTLFENVKFILKKKTHTKQRQQYKNNERYERMCQYVTQFNGIWFTLSQQYTY